MRCSKSLAGIIIVMLLASIQSIPATAERAINIQDASASNTRTALVIGNSAYNVSPLKNPSNDASDMASALRECGFDVTLIVDASQRKMEMAIKSFGKKLRKGGIGLFYYAGHGIQAGGRNYLIPVDADIESESDVKYEAVDAGRVLGKMEDAGNGFNIVILDACRNNPFARSFRSAEKGLAKMDAPTGSFIAYATAPGSVAADGEGRNGLYTKHLLQYMRQPNLTLENVFKNVRLAVVNKTSNKQIPWESSSLVGEFYFQRGKEQPAVTQVPAVPAPVGQMVQTLSAEEELWKTVKDSSNEEHIKMYLDEYPNGRFSVAARVKIQQLQKGSLTIETDPSDAQIRFLNLNKEFSQGMKLEEGSYQLEISSPRHETRQDWVVLKSGEDKKINIRLKKVDEVVWAVAARASTQYSSSDWAAFQATGPPNTNGCGDHATAWATRKADRRNEWLELGYPSKVLTTKIRIYETFNPGAVIRVEGFVGGIWRTVWSGQDPNFACPGIAELILDEPVELDRIRIHLDSLNVKGWNEIDAVALVF